jgi:hypothetical protein
MSVSGGHRPVSATIGVPPSVPPEYTAVFFIMSCHMLTFFHGLFYHVSDCLKE